MTMYDEIPTRVLAEFNAKDDHSALRHAYLMKNPVSKAWHILFLINMFTALKGAQFYFYFSLYKGPGGILFFLQNNTGVFRFKL